MQACPLVSVIIPCFNSEEWIAETLDSVFGQTYKNVEVIIIDDGSTDNTKKVLDSYGEPIKYIYQDNRGPSAARNVGIQNCKGEYIAFLDSDDLWEENKLETQIDILERNKNIHLVLTDVSVVNTEKQYLYTNRNSVPKEKRALITELFRGNITMNTPTIVARRKSITYTNGFMESLPMREDHFFLMEFANDFQIAHIDIPLVKRRIREDSISHSVKPEEIFELHQPFIRQSLEKFGFLKNYEKEIQSNLRISVGKKYWKLNNFKKSLYYLMSGIQLKPLFLPNYIFFALVLFRRDYSDINKIIIKKNHRQSIK